MSWAAAALRSGRGPLALYRRSWIKNQGLCTGTPQNRPTSSSSSSLSQSLNNKMGLLELEEVEKVLSDVKAGDIKVIPVQHLCDWTDFMVFASGRSTWHVQNIAQALIYKVKQKQKGADHMLLPSVEGQMSGNWIVIDSGPIIVHALDAKARAYYNLESRWTTEISPERPNQDLGKALVKIRRKNNSKKRVQQN